MQKKQLEVSPFLQKNATLLKAALAAAEGIKLGNVTNAQVIISPSAARAAAQKPVPVQAPEDVKLPKDVQLPTAPPSSPTANQHPHAKEPIPQEVYEPKPKPVEPKPKPERPTVQVVGGRWF